jgi:hypothetical protein
MLCKQVPWIGQLGRTTVTGLALLEFYCDTRAAISVGPPGRAPRRWPGHATHRAAGRAARRSRRSCRTNYCATAPLYLFCSMRHKDHRRAVWMHYGQGPTRIHLADYSLRHQREGRAGATMLYYPCNYLLAVPIIARLLPSKDVGGWALPQLGGSRTPLGV